MKIVVNHQLVNYMDEGGGKVILMLHGWGANLKTFDAMAQQLTQRYRVVRLDFPGFGESSMPPQHWELDDYARLVAAFLEKLEIGELHTVITHSFGGRVIIKMASLGYVNADKLILIDSGGIRHSSSVRNQAYKLLAKTGKRVANLPGLRRFQGTLRQRLYTSAGSLDYIEAGELRRIFVRLINEDVRELAGSITQPTLILWGEEDIDTPVADGRIFHKKIKGSEFVLISEAGHFSYLDQPEKVMQEIEAFL